MKVRRFTFFLAALACLSLSPAAQARAPAIPKDADKFTEFVAKRFTEAEPASKVTVKGQLTLDIVRANGSHIVYLNNVWSFCERDRRACRKQIDDFIHATGAINDDGPANAKPSDIRLVIRGDGYIEQLKQIAANDPKHAGIYRPFVAGLWILCVIDQPHGIATLNREQLAKLRLTEDQVFALGLKNLAATLKPLADDTHTLSKSGLTFATGDFYESSRLLLHDSWAALSKTYNGHLVVVIPSSDLLIYGNGSGNGDREVLSAFARSAAEKMPKPISVTLLQWTPAGWDVVTP